jgi:thiosulfate reductase cytochrome b subunit
MGVALILTAVFLAARGTAVAQEQTPIQPTGSPLHPTFALLDADGRNVLDSGAPISTMQTCGQCHDTEFIAGHSFHADVGLSQFGQGGVASWDSSPGLYGRWDPLTYRYLSREGDDVLDLTTPEWLMTLGLRHAGGGPATTSRDGLPLTNLAVAPHDPQTHIVDPETGELVAWDWDESGTVEMNCFLCHTANPNNKARGEMLQSGQFAWANTATLFNSGIVEPTLEGWHYNAGAFAENGELLPNYISIQDPTNENCGACHGTVHTDLQTPLTLETSDFFEKLDVYSTLTTGQVMSGQKLLNSGLNLADKESLNRSWDIHTERVLACTDCHYALNNPVHFQELGETQPEHLTYDPRRLDLGEYLYRPLHQFAKGQSAQSAIAQELDNTLRRCESCHSIENTHNWLPYKERHTEAMACESCHTPQLYAPALESVNWTAVHPDGSPLTTWRGMEGKLGDQNALITGYEPVLLPRQNEDGSAPLAPYNLITAWYWVYGDPERPVPLRDLQAVWLEGDGYEPHMLQVFDANEDGRLSEAELLIDSQAKETLIATRLAERGLANAHIVGEIRPYSINHNTATGDWATRDCRTCHGEESRITQAISLSGSTPGGATPTFVNSGGTAVRGDILNQDGTLFFKPDTQSDDTAAPSIYIFGHSSVYWVDWLGVFLFVGVVLGVVGHSSLRVYFRRQQTPAHAPTGRVYMYGVYERLWHWVQTAVILGLLFTGLIIHKPDKFGLFSFNYVVQVHNILALILLVNAALSLFYHLASGEIRQYLPHPRGFIDQAAEQAIYYLRGIFRGDPHPFEKTPDRKLNPLQQITYFGLLNVLLPLQILTGILMWGAQRWPDIAARTGGLPFLAPFHTLIAWMLAAFIVMHVYLTTTGHTPTAAIKGMMVGYDEVVIE